MRVALAQTNPLIADLEGIAADLRQRILRAGAEGADLVVFPELAAIGYPPRDLLRRRSLVEGQVRMLSELAAGLPLPALVGCVEPLPGAPVGSDLANAVALLADGAVRMVYRKRLLPDYDVFDERRYFAPGEAPAVVEIAGRRVGLSVCEDIWNRPGAGLPYAVDPVADLVGSCDLVVNCSASPYHFRKPRHRHELLAAVAARVGAPVCYVNQVGGQDELLFDGGSCVVHPDGGSGPRAPRWEAALAVGDVEERSDAAGIDDDLADLRAGIVMGIRDYCAKTGQRRLVLGLSGGIDSAVAAALGVEALGAERLCGLLMPGPYSSEGSVADARESARLLGIEHHVCPIGPPNAAMLESLASAFRDTPANVAEENLQSRLRGALVMAYANRFDAMALTTGNKSEAAVGYCTLYGDTNGGLGPIADCYKSTVYALARQLNADRPRIPAASITKAPSAELAPDQLDTDSLPPYQVLDPVLKDFIEDVRDPAEMIAAAEDPDLVSRVIRMVEVNEYKRRQSPPVLRISPKAFGMGRRIPLARRIDP